MVLYGTPEAAPSIDIELLRIGLAALVIFLFMLPSRMLLPAVVLNF